MVFSPDSKIASKMFCENKFGELIAIKNNKILFIIRYYLGPLELPLLPLEGEVLPLPPDELLTDEDPEENDRLLLLEELDRDILYDLPFVLEFPTEFEFDLAEFPSLLGLKFEDLEPGFAL